ncbi:helix-turn-helix domain-containing protein [Pedobacter gandavensis]|uniref:AraC family transcriptional regulator n=1 Tax=Pedobacter gandavensis TaxID=2679963 RepID=UPI002930A3BF|nr:helix-turn-helix domain-containing protein [Pedobacter gandavensis]
MQLPPQHSVQGLVKHYLILNQQTDQQQQYRMFSDGNPGMVFHLKNPLLQWNEGDLTPGLQPRSFVYGQLSRYNTISSSGALDMIVVVLEPHAIFSHFHIPADQLTDQRIPLIDLFGQEARDLEEQVLSALTIDVALNCIEKFLSKGEFLSNGLKGEIAEAMQVIYQHRGMINIDQLLQLVPITERQLERKFREVIGTTPKKFADTIKFQNLLKLFQQQPAHEKISALIYRSGYYDQAHLNNNFKRMTGLTPGHYKDARQLLAINLMTLY